MSLTRSVGLRVGPIVLGTLVKHYLEKIRRDFVQDNSKGKEKDELVQLRQDELIYDEIFTVVKAFLEAATLHPVEDIQSFSNTRTPSPPWVHVVRVRVPMSSCDEAAKYLITALGGQELAVKLVGGVKWWQVRSLDGVDAQWITAKKDWQEAKRRYKDRENTQRDEKHEPTLDQSESATYNQDMDTMRCILYAHGGGYYFGSVDQERYSIQRYARKINGRVFAMNYRLAPQYPFPCAIQDLVASYLYLIRPPPGASHLPVKPSHIVVAGDSAGGGLILALLQVLRDASLPLPAGGILVSPWCDLTHSFPSIHTNTATDVMPPYGFSLHKPSTLWPPPDEELAGRVRTGLKQRFRAVFKGEGDPNASVLTFGTSTLEPDSNAPGNGANSDPPGSSDIPNGMPINVGATTPLPLPNSSFNHANPFDSNKSAHDSIILQAQNGEILSIQQQIQLYTTNALLGHPLVSPALGYLGGLPPLMFVISDKEVLRDEGIYVAHKAVHPEQFPIRDSTRALYPALYGIEERFKGKPTPVHLQLYDADTAHVLPVLFSFTTPAKYCFRAMAIFCKYVTGMPLFPTNSDDAPNTPQKRASESSPTGLLSSLSSSITSALVGSGAETGAASPPLSPRSIKSFTISGSEIVSKSVSSIRRMSRKSTGSDYPIPDLKRSASEYQGEFERCAGDPIVYSETSEFPSLFSSLMIRERVSTRGVIRPLEPFSDLPAFSIPPQLIGEISERAVRRYIAGRTFFEHKFSGTRKAIEQRRRKHLQKARKDTTRNMSALKGSSSPFNIGTALLASSGWSWSWALDNNEHPPPSSLVARRDTHEALMLARVADQGVLQDEQGGGVSAAMSGNNLWSVVVGFLTPAGNGNASAIRTGGEEHNRREKDSELSPNRRKEKPNAQSSSSSQAVSEDTEAPSTSTINSTPSETSSFPISSPPSKIRLLGKKPSVNALRARLASMGTSRGKSPPPLPPAAITVASSSNT
ncbi:alpha beta-hydrolase [Lentinula lateritia]|nr:alpha beta-hydrolase [Lentinula lateritia]